MLRDNALNLFPDLWIVYHAAAIASKVHVQIPHTALESCQMVVYRSNPHTHVGSSFVGATRGALSDPQRVRRLFLAPPELRLDRYRGVLDPADSFQRAIRVRVGGSRDLAARSISGFDCVGDRELHPSFGVQPSLGSASLLGQDFPAHGGTTLGQLQHPTINLPVLLSVSLFGLFVIGNEALDPSL